LVIELAPAWEGFVPDISDEHLKAIGQIAIDFGRLEYFLDAFVGFLLGNDAVVGEIVCRNHESFAKRVSIMSELFELKYTDENLREQFKQIVSEIRKIQEQRNAMFHSSWFLGRADDTDVLVRIARKGTNRYSVFTDDDLRKMALTVRTVLDEFHRFSHIRVFEKIRSASTPS
jgi:hypothetical protein